MTGLLFHVNSLRLISYNILGDVQNHLVFRQNLVFVVMGQRSYKQIARTIKMFLLCYPPMIEKYEKRSGFAKFKIFKKNYKF